MSTRPELSFDGLGINGSDEHRTRVATFATEADAEKYGPMFEAAPAMVAALQHLAKYGRQCDVKFIAGQALATLEGTR